MASDRLISSNELGRHNAADNIWIAVNGVIYDVTDFAPTHPGGLRVILDNAGKDASRAYDEVHSPSIIINSLGAEKRVGILDQSTVIRAPEQVTQQSVSSKGENPPLSTLINSYDFEKVASKTLSKKAWAFYSAGATDLITRDDNKKAFDRIGFRPRILRDVTTVNTETKLLGCDSSIPLFIAPVGMAKLAHPDGEKAFAKGAAKAGIIPCISTAASYSASEIVGFAPLNHPFFFQLYVDKNRAKSERLLREVGELGMRAIFVTVDAPVPGKREADERLHVDESLSSPISGVKAINDSKGGGIARVMGSFIDPGLSWTDIAWLRSCTNLPIVIKGIQTAEDARLALEHGVDGIVVSNHGGRSLDTSPAAIMVLLELQRRCPEVFKSMEVFLDGGIRRGTDVIKALCLGAKGVAVGRPFLYALTYGSDGIERLTEILKDEIETTLRLLGVTSLSQLHPGLLNTRHVDHLIPENYQESEAPSLQSKRVVAKKEIAKL